MPTMFLIFNHTLTLLQETDARASLGVERIVIPPPRIREQWSCIPPDLPELQPYLKPVQEWLASEAKAGNYVLIQGDFGACYLMANFCLDVGFVPVYSTTRRDAAEKRLEDGSVELTHQFRHQIFRRYGV